MFNTLRSERESILMIKSMTRDCILPQGLLTTVNSDTIKDMSEAFEDAMKLDAVNEMRPKTAVVRKNWFN